MNHKGNKKINQISYPEQYSVGIYIRTGKEVKGLDVTKFQKDRIQEFCDDMNLKITNWYIDNGFDNFAEERPSYNKLIEDIKNKKINMIVTANLARIARSRGEMEELIKLQNEYGFRTIFTDSREELLKDRSALKVEDYIREDATEEELECEDDISDEYDY